MPRKKRSPSRCRSFNTRKTTTLTAWLSPVRTKPWPFPKCVPRRWEPAQTPRAAASGRRGVRYHLDAYEQVEAAWRLKPDRYRRTLAASWYDLAGAFADVADWARAENAGREALRRTQEILQSDPSNSEARRDIACASYQFGRALDGLRRRREAAAQFERVLDIATGLLKNDPANQEDMELIINAEDRLASYQMEAGNPGAALEYYRRSVEMLVRLPAADWAAYLAADYDSMGDAAARGDRAQAARYYSQAAPIWTRLRETGQLPRAYANRPDEPRHAKPQTVTNGSPQ